jgi:hypothetical protein
MNAGSKVLVRALVVAVLAATVAGCGSKDRDEAAAGKEGATAGHKQKKPATAPVPQEERMANAVVVGKAAAAVDLQYNLLARPAAGQPLEIELSFVPRAAADALEIVANGMPGLDVVTGGTASFKNVTAGEHYDAKLLVQPAADGIYYVGITATLSTKVQTDTRAFSVPVVVGTLPASAKPAAATAADASAAQPVKSSPAVETTGN